MEDQNILLIEIALSIVGLIGAAIAWVYKLISKKFDKMDDCFERMDNKIETKIYDLRSEMQEQNAQLRNEMQEQSAQLRNEINQFRTEVHQGFYNLQNYIFLGKIDKKLNENSEEKPKK